MQHPLYTEWRSLLRQKGVPTQVLRDGLALDLDGVTLTVLYATDDTDSCVVRAAAGTQSALLAGALSQKGIEAWLRAEGEPASALAAQVLLPPSRPSAEFLTRVRWNWSRTGTGSGCGRKDKEKDALTPHGLAC